MRDFIKSLNKKQQQGFVDLVSKNSRMLPAVTYAVQESLNGNSDPYNQLFGVENNSDKFPKHSGESIDPAVSSFLERKNAEQVRLNSENQKRINNSRNGGYNV